MVKGDISERRAGWPGSGPASTTLAHNNTKLTRRREQDGLGCYHGNRSA
jgi:hypothetical protein